MLLAEEQQYIEEMEAKEETTLERQAKMRERAIEEMEAKEETTLERQAKMRERAKFLKEKREQERLKLVDEKLDQRWRYLLSS